MIRFRCYQSGKCLLRQNGRYADPIEGFPQITIEVPINHSIKTEIVNAVYTAKAKRVNEPKVLILGTEEALQLTHYIENNESLLLSRDYLTGECSFMGLPIWVVDGVGVSVGYDINDAIDLAWQQQRKEEK